MTLNHQDADVPEPQADDATTPGQSERRSGPRLRTHVDVNVAGAPATASCLEL